MKQENTMNVPSAERTGKDAPAGKEAPSVADRSTEFVAVQGGAETSSASGLLVAAYVVMWALVFGFVWLTSRRQRALDARIAELEAALRRHSGGGSAAPSAES